MLGVDGNPTIHNVLFLYIYTAHLTVQSNWKRFQCERPRDKSREVSKKRHLNH